MKTMKGSIGFTKSLKKRHSQENPYFKKTSLKIVVKGKKGSMSNGKMWMMNSEPLEGEITLNLDLLQQEICKLQLSDHIFD